MSDPLSTARVLNWEVRLGVLQEARRQAAAAASEDPQAERILAWDARLNNAAAAVAETDEDGFDFWLDRASQDNELGPHEALLVAAWETRVADVLDTAEGITAEAGAEFDSLAENEEDGL